MSKFFTDSIYNVLRQILNIIIGMLIVVIIARELGPSGQGKYALIILLPNLLGTFLTFGVGVSAAYFIGKQKYTLDTIYKTNVILASVFSIISLIIAFFILLFFHEVFFQKIPQSLLFLVLISVPFLFFKQFLLVIFQGLQDFKPYNAITIIGKLASLLAILVFLLVFNIGLIGAVTAFIIGELISVIIAQFILYKNYSLSFKVGSLSKGYLKEVLVFGVKTHVSNIMAFLNYRSDIIIISYFMNPVALGLYVASVNIAERLWVISQSISTVLFPKISSLTSYEERNELTSTVSRILMVLSLLAGIVLYFSAKWILNILFGEEYLGATVTFQLLLPGIVLGSVSRIIANDIAGRGRPEINMYVSFILVAMNVVLNIILIPIYGINGAALATTATYVVNFILKIYIFRSISKQSIHHFLLLKKNDLVMLKLLIYKGKQ